MRYDIVEEVVYDDSVRRILERGSCSRTDRLGIMAVFCLKDVPGREYVARETLRMLSNVIALLARNYTNILEFGEANGVWITYREYSHEVVVSHKYWTVEQVSLFREILIVMSIAHGWIWNECGGEDEWEREL